ncbi:hypothetical protein GIB67_028945 [Kingdonia uniflora]|uniref:Uncharacterized protein n=1 Tax=Kingdonia uniflora TaxID=39325 RepID=A0A7J7LC76_9MAGN|nr:hypothetical protein GIB67_028945 [Kingdonia uniflora]
MQNLTMSLEEEEYGRTGDQEGSEFDYSVGHVSQLCFLSGKKRKNDFEEVVNVSTEPPSLLSQNYEARDFWKLTQPDGKGHLSTSVATTPARVGFKCRSVLVNLREIYLILIEETQIPPSRLGDYPGWIMELGSPHGTTWHTIPSIASTSTINVPTGNDFFAMTEGMRKLILDITLDLEARHLHDESRITHLTANLRRAEGRLSQLNDYLDGKGL